MSPTGVGRLVCAAAVILATCAGTATDAAEVSGRVLAVKDMGELKRALERAGPGTTIELAGGRYRGGVFKAGLKGAPGAFIVIRSADPEQPAVFEQQLHFPDAAYLGLESFVVRGSRANGLNIDDGGTFETPAHHVTIRGVVVEDVGPQGNLDGIKLSGVEDFLVEGCVVRRWGSGGSGIDMVGCRRGVIAGCTFEHTDTGASSGVQAKGGTSEIVIWRCSFQHAGRRAVNIGGSTGEAYFRPQGARYESRRIVVIGNTFVGSVAPIAFVTTEESQVLYNDILFPGTWVFRILQEKPVPRFIACRNNTFAQNVVVWRASQVRTHVNVGPNTQPGSFRFESNQWYAVDAPGRSRPKLPAGETGGVYGRDPGIDLEKETLVDSGARTREFGAGARGEEKAWRELGETLAPWAAGRVR